MTQGIDWLDDGTPYSARFGDRYHGAQGALAQAQAVFLQGCGLPAAWAGQAQWRVLETGFGFGLNFLATWAAWRADPARPRLLHFISLEAWPVPGDDLLRMAAREPELLPLARELLTQYWGLLPGMHRLWFDSGRVLLTLCIGDAQPLLRQHPWQADSVYLDGFDPRCNPELWSAETLQAVARCCRRGTRLATWSVAGHVRETLAQCGFEVQKVPGLPPKHTNLQACFNPHWEPRKAPSPWPAPAAQPQACIVIGAGLSGGACAASLARRGWQVTVLDEGDRLAYGASGLPAGLFGPHLSGDDNRFSRVARAGVRAMLQQSGALLQMGEDWNPGGVLERRPAHKTGIPPGWEDGPGTDWYHLARPGQLQAANLPPDAAACWHVHAGWVRPARLVAQWLAQPGIQVRLNSPATRLQRGPQGDWQVLDDQGRTIATAPLVVLATGPATRNLLAQVGAPRLPLNSVRGQLSWGPQPGPIAGLPPFPVNGQGALIAHVPHAGGLAWHAGATFERGEEDLPPSAAEQAQAHALNRQRLQDLLPQADALLAAQWDDPTQLHSWAGVRCTTPDRLPFVGPVDDALPGLWVCTGMGARGLTRAALCGELLAALLHGEPLPMDAALARALLAQRQHGARQ